MGLMEEAGKAGEDLKAKMDASAESVRYMEMMDEASAKAKMKMKKVE